MDINPRATDPQNSTTRHAVVRLIALALAAIIAMLSVSPAMAQVRGKRPDRGTYQPPQLESVELESLDAIRPARGGRSTSQKQVTASQNQVTVSSDRVTASKDGTLRKVAYQNVDLVEHQSNHRLHEPVVQQEHQAVQYEEYGYETYGNEVYNDGDFARDSDFRCDQGGCDSYGCDSMGCDGNCSGSIFNSSLSRCRDQWFGSLELLLMHRSGDRLPPLITTGPDEAGADSQTLFGGETLLKDTTAGGRVTIGTWIDPQHCRSLVLRGWTATEDNYGFFADQDSNAILGLPFRNVSDGEVPSDDVQIIASPGRATGSVRVNGTSNVFGGDLSVRQHWFGKYGGNVDILYGYQYMRLSEDMTIVGPRVSLDDDFAPEGSLLATTDAFDIDNEFHGGQFGIAGNYREACWSFSGLAKVGFGSLSRRAELSGETFTSIDGNNAIDTQGLHVRDTNSGTRTDNTFGWIPELDFSLGYHKFPNYELTIGYHIIAMTDALQVSGALDPNLASNLSDPALGTQSPSANFRYDTFYVQGIHFGIQYVH